MNKARKISSRVEGDSVFEKLPIEETQGTPEWLKKLDAQASNTDPMEVWGQWPGDETLEELLAELD